MNFLNIFIFLSFFTVVGIATEARLSDKQLQAMVKARDLDVLSKLQVQIYEQCDEVLLLKPGKAQKQLEDLMIHIFYFNILDKSYEHFEKMPKVYAIHNKVIDELLLKFPAEFQRHFRNGLKVMQNPNTPQD